MYAAIAAVIILSALFLTLLEWIEVGFVRPEKRPA
jgi:hypothetical protein